MSQYRKGSVLKNGLGMIGRIGLITAGIIGLYLSLGFAFVQAEELNIDLAADTYVDRDFPDTNYGGDDTLDLHYGIVGTTPDGHAHYIIRQMLLQFDDSDLAAIPDGATITNARLEVFLTSSGSDEDVYVDVGYITAAWDEMSVTWNSLDDRYAWPRSPRITRLVDTTPGWRDWDVTRIVRHWNSGFYDNHGFILMIYLEAGTPIEDYSRLSVSKEGLPMLAPKLTVEYEMEPPEPVVDLTITNLEINQVVQILEDPAMPTPGSDNSVSLIAEKPTIVRLYVDTGPAAGPVHGVTAYLYRVDGGVEERISPLNPIIAVPAPDRENRHHTINFRLPTEWIHDDVGFYAVINPPTLSTRVPETDYSNNRFPAADGDLVAANFEAEGRDMDIAWQRLNYTWPGWGGDPMADARVGQQAAVNFIRSVFPVASQNVTYRPWPGGGFDWSTSINSSSSSLINELNDIYELSDIDPKPDFLYAWIPEFAYGGIGRSDPPYAGGSGVVAFGEDRDPNMLYRVIFTHELGHNLNQTGHGSLPNARLSDGEYGYDVLHIDPLDRGVMRHYIEGGVSFDLMDYMLGGTHPSLFDGNHAWVTPYTYEGVHDELSPAGFLEPYWPAWYWRNIFPVLGLKQIDLRKSDISKLDPKMADKALVVSGVIDKTGGAALRPLFVLQDKFVDVSQEKGTYSVELIGGDQKVLSAFNFNVDFSNVDYAGKLAQQAPFRYTIPYSDKVQTIALKYKDKILDRVKVSKNAPEVAVAYPNVRTILKEEATVKWKADDADGDPLTYKLLFSRDGGVTWLALTGNLKTTECRLNVNQLAGGEKVFFRVIASDGVNTTIADSHVPVMIEDKPPAASILTPEKEMRTIAGADSVFIGQGTDLEDGILSDKALKWISSINGEIGFGRTIKTSRLSQGIHTITLIAEDHTGKTGSDTTTVYVDKDWFNTYSPEQ